MGKYLVTGATGTIGSEVVKSLIKKGLSVRAASRHPDKSKALFSDQAEHVYFDYEDSSTFSNILDDVEGVFVLGPPINPNLFDLIEPFVDFIIKKGNKRVVYLSSYKAEILDELPFHKQMEDKLKSSNLDWRIIKPGFFAQNFGNYERENILERKIVFAPAGDGETAFISSRDVGAVIAELLSNDQYKHQSIELTGPENYSYEEVASLLSDILGDKISYPNPDKESFKGALKQGGAPDFVADYMVSIYGLIKDGHVKNKADRTEEITGRKPERLKEVLKRDFS